jgi:hypothetical protein
MARRLRDTLPGSEQPPRAAAWEFLRPSLSPRLTELHRDAFVVDDAAKSTLDPRPTGATRAFAACAAVRA